MEEKKTNLGKILQKDFEAHRLPKEEVKARVADILAIARKQNPSLFKEKA